MGRWEEVQHTADLAIHVWGESLEDLFRTAAEGMFSLVAATESRTVTTASLILTAPDVEALLVDWLSELLYLHETHHAAFDQPTFARLSRTALDAEVAGRAITETRAHIKAVTYHMLRVEKGKDGYETEIVFDV